MVPSKVQKHTSIVPDQAYILQLLRLLLCLAYITVVFFASVVASLSCIVLISVTFCMHVLLIFESGTFIVALWTSGSPSKYKFKHSCSALVRYCSTHCYIFCHNCCHIVHTYTARHMLDQKNKFG